MRLMYRVDSDGYYMPGEDFFSEYVEVNSTDVPPLDSEGRGMYRPRLVKGVWVDEGVRPPDPVPERTVQDEVQELKQVLDILLMGGM